jgi:hypothetical protein
MKEKIWYKENPNDKVWWLDTTIEGIGLWVFSFDKEKEYNLYADFPYDGLTKEQKEALCRECLTARMMLESV